MVIEEFVKGGGVVAESVTATAVHFYRRMGFLLVARRSNRPMALSCCGVTTSV
jgi:hypothetical protein